MCAAAAAGTLFLTGGRVRSQLKAAGTGAQVASLYVTAHMCEHICVFVGSELAPLP